MMTIRHDPVKSEGLNYSLNRFQQKPNHEDVICVSHRWPAPISHTSSLFIKSRWVSWVWLAVVGWQHQTGSSKARVGNTFTDNNCCFCHHKLFVKKWELLAIKRFIKCTWGKNADISHLWDGIAAIRRHLPAYGRNAAPAAKILTRYQPHWTFLAFIVCVQSPFISQFACCIQHMPVWFQSGLPSACWETN